MFKPITRQRKISLNTQIWYYKKRLESRDLNPDLCSKGATKNTFLKQQYISVETVED
jgi:hypothetical protein